jgi:glycylpeptide N-tetradecanoyltransferase
MKLHEIGFSPLPAKSTKERQVLKYHLPANTSTKGLRPMEERDVDAVLDLLKRYLDRFDMAPIFTREEVDHWLLPKESASHEQVIWSYVVEDPESNKITDFFSFYCLESLAIGSKKHANVKAAYLFYYATETAFNSDGSTKARDIFVKRRLNGLVADALVLAKRFGFDVFNALTLLDNSLFLEQQKFGAGDGQLHYYLYNYRANPVHGGVDVNNNIDDRNHSGIGVVML